MHMLKDKTAIVTGAGQGIGRAIALKLAENGAKVALSDIAEEGIQEVAKEIAALGGQAMTVQANVADLKGCEEMVKKVAEQFGSIDILVNNAGVTRDTLMMRMKEEDWDFVISVNLKGVFNCCKAVTRMMMKQRSGRIINISSVVGLMGNPGQVNYSASKAGVIGMTKTLAKEFGSRGVNVNAIAPGFIRSAMTDKLAEDVKQQYIQAIPRGMFGEASHVADAVLFLAGPLSSYITGEIIRVDGGLAM